MHGALGLGPPRDAERTEETAPNTERNKIEIVRRFSANAKEILDKWRSDKSKRKISCKVVSWRVLLFAVSSSFSLAPFSCWFIRSTSKMTKLFVYIYFRFVFCSVHSVEQSWSNNNKKNRVSLGWCRWCAPNSRFCILQPVNWRTPSPDEEK